jgi:hypothetical protein
MSSKICAGQYGAGAGTLWVFVMLPTAAYPLIMLELMLYGFCLDSILKATHLFIQSQIVFDPNT